MKQKKFKDILFEIISSNFIYRFYNPEEKSLIFILMTQKYKEVMSNYIKDNFKYIDEVELDKILNNNFNNYTLLKSLYKFLFRQLVYNIAEFESNSNICYLIPKLSLLKYIVQTCKNKQIKVYLIYTDNVIIKEEQFKQLDFNIIKI